MASIKSITVLLRMNNGEIRAGLELRAVTLEDERDLTGMIGFARQHGRYDDNTKVLAFTHLGGPNLYWLGLGVDDRSAFENIPRGNWFNGNEKVLFMSDPYRFHGAPDDLSVICLCQNGTSCRTCRLQERVKSLEQELYELGQQINDPEDQVEAENNEEEEEEEEEEAAEGQFVEDGLWGEEREAGDAENQLEENEVKEGEVRVKEEEEEQHTEDALGGDRGVEEDGPTALQLALHRAQKAEAGNIKLLAEVTRLRSENKNLRQDLEKQRKQSSSPTTQAASSTRVTPLAGDDSDASYGDSSHPHRRGGGETRPEGAAGSRQKLRATMRADVEKVKKRQYSTYDEDEVTEQDSDEEPPFKRHRPAARVSAKAVSSRKNGMNTCESEKSVKPHQERPDDSDDSDDETFNPGPQGRRSGFSRGAGRRALAGPRTNQIIAKTGRRTNNSQAGLLDAFGIGFAGPSSGKAIGGFAIHDESDTATSDTPDAIPASTLTTSASGTTSAGSTTVNSVQNATSLPPNPAGAATSSRRAKRWANNELQALITLVGAHRNAPVGPDGKKPEVLHDVKLFELMSRQLRAQGIDRSAGACKNEWNRRGRETSGIDNRKIAKPSQMATSLQ